MTYGTDALLEEVSYVAYHFHWTLDALLDLEHADRSRFVEQIGALNRRALNHRTQGGL